MIYTTLTKKAMKICFEAHKHQVDKTGIPYVFHPIHLAEQMDDEYSTVVALLHDVVEDTDFTIEDLSCDFPQEVCEAIAVMTHNPVEDYFEYVNKIKKNAIARKVKLADLIHNSDLTRLDMVTDRDLLRKIKYSKAIEILENADDFE